jgi:hypothetical protein
MNSGLVLLGVLALGLVALVFAARRWGKASVKSDVSKGTIKELLRIRKASLDAEKDVSALTSDELDEFLREAGLTRDK